MSKLKSATVAAACAIGASAMMITPAAAAGTATATYNCGVYGSSVATTFTRSTSNLLTLKATITYVVPTTIPVGGLTVAAGGQTLANAAAITPGVKTSITVTKAGSTPVTAAPTTIVITITPPGITVTCTLKASPAPAGFPI